MIATDAELISVLRQYNPWWSGHRVQDLPPWRRVAFRELLEWLTNPPTGRALLLSGARQVGKTTLFLQAIDQLLESGVPPSGILYATFDHPLLKLVGPEGVMRLWREFEPVAEGQQYVFLDEIQTAKNWQVWLKHQVDFEKRRRIAVTGSATPLTVEGQESGVGRWHTIKLATLSFYEYLQIKNLPAPHLPAVASLSTVFDWEPNQIIRVGEEARALVGYFHDYLLRGGFPECAKVESITLAQKLLREDIVDKVLKRDMTALFRVRRVVELEQTFLYLCLHDGGQLDVQELCKSLELKRPTVSNFMDLLEATHLIHRLRPFGYGKEILRGRPKVYLADAAIVPSVLLKGKTLLEDATQLGLAVETAFFKHVFTRYYAQSVGFSYWRGKKDIEVDIVADVNGQLIPFEVKYRGNIVPSYYKGLLQFCQEKKVARGYLIVKDFTDFKVSAVPERETRLLQIPAPLACYWLGRSELEAGV